MRDETKDLGSERVIPVFPLSNVVLFPKVRLPLHIFEPRYRQMVKDAVATHGLIGMALLRGDWQKDYRGNPDIYPIGCIGKIVSITPIPDGRYNIVLLGLREYEVKKHICNLSSYRQAMVILRDDPEEMERISFSSLKDKILDLVRRIADYDESPLLSIFRDPSLDQETWLNLCSYFLDLSIMEKQSLLEAKSLEERATSLLNFLQFKVIEQRALLENIGAAGGKKPPH